MRSAHEWLLRGFLGAFGLLIITQVLLMSLGTGAVLRNYAANQLDYLEELARQILINPEAVPAEAPQHSGPFFVFSADKSLIYSNRGKGRSIPPEDYRPVSYQGTIIGWLYAGEVRFLDTEANRLFMTSLVLLAGVSMLISLAIAAAAAIRSARRIAGPVQLLQHDIRIMRNLKEVERREFSIAELSDISASLHEVSLLLSGEEEHKRQWMQNIAHDLRTPISGLRGQLEGMRDGVLEANPGRFIRNLKEIERLEELAAGISELYALEILDHISTEKIAAEEFCTELQLPFEQQLKKKKIRLSCDIRIDSMTGNRALLMRAIRNILANGISYSPEGSQIAVSLDYTSHKKCSIRIANDGPPIPEDQLERIFQRFYRGEFSRTSPGSGLGLNITREIIHLHGGTIDARNLEPTGVEFRILLQAE